MIHPSRQIDAMSATASSVIFLEATRNWAKTFVRKEMIFEK